MNSLVITSIASSTTALMENSFQIAHNNNCRIIVIADKKSGDIKVKNGNFLSVSSQNSLSYEIIKYLPWNSYSRKNIGYLEALKTKSEWIIETDDDNLPSNEFFNLDLHRDIKVRIIEKKEWINIYKYFGNNIVWPRGFPLNQIKSKVILETKESEISIDSVGVFQSIADQDPDVDAIFRLTQNLPQTFINNSPIFLINGAVCPFNSQATWWNYKYGVLMYFPSTISWRVADIWRSYIATRVLQSNDIGIVFVGPLVTQIRNEHDLLIDFKEEIDCYLNAEKIWTILSEIPDKNLRVSPEVAIIYVYNHLVNLGVIPHEEIEILNAWVEDVTNLNP